MILPIIDCKRFSVLFQAGTLPSKYTPTKISRSIPRTTVFDPYTEIVSTENTSEFFKVLHGNTMKNGPAIHIRYILFDISLHLLTPICFGTRITGTGSITGNLNQFTRH